MSSLNDLQKRNNALKSKLLHDKLKHGTYHFNTFKREILLVLNSYKTHRSLIKASKTVGLDKNLAMEWFIEGLFGNPEFRGFYLVVSQMDKFKPQTISPEVEEVISPEVEEVVKNYTISEYFNSCVYTAEIDGEKISIISKDLDTLKQLVRSKNLPID